TRENPISPWAMIAMRIPFSMKEGTRGICKTPLCLLGEGVTASHHQTRSGIEAIALAANRLNMAGILRIALELLPDPGDVHVDGAGGDVGAVLPNFAQQLLARDHAMAVINQIAQELQLFLRHADGLTAFADLGALEIDVDIFEMEAADGDAILLANAAQQSVDAGQQLGWVERLCQIIVGAEFEPDDAIGHLRFGGEYQDGGVDAFLAQIAANLESGFFGEHQVENDQGEVAAGCAGEPGFSVRSEFNVVAFGAEQVGNGERQPRLVFNQQNARVHGSTPGARRACAR